MIRFCISRVEIQEVNVADANVLVAVVRALTPVVLGARFHHIEQSGHAIDLTLTEIRRYPQITVDALDPAHAARLTLTGTCSILVRAGDVLQGLNPME